MTTLGKMMVGASMVGQVVFIAAAGGVFGDPGRANMPVLLLICTLFLSLVIAGSRT